MAAWHVLGDLIEIKCRIWLAAGVLAAAIKQTWPERGLGHGQWDEALAVSPIPVAYLPMPGSNLAMKRRTFKQGFRGPFLHYLLERWCTLQWLAD
jgi:hypothetical protein